MHSSVLTLHFHRYSQPSAELVVLFPEASGCLYAAFFKRTLSRFLNMVPPR